MKLRLLDLLVCPIDKTPLELIEWESSPIKLSTQDARRAERLKIKPELLTKDIVTGVLVNRSRRIYYPICHGIPRMLVFPTGVAKEFAQQHAARLARELPGFTTPQLKPMPGEHTVLRTFSSEWTNYSWNEQAYWSLSPDGMYESMRFMLNLAQNSVKDKLVLEVGIGIGGIANYMARQEECELIGIDLSYGVDPAYAHFGNNKFLHILQASAFAPPFQDNMFDFVYSQGVLHRTFSTKAAFDRVCKLPKPGGRLYIWVWNPESEKRNIVRRSVMLMENAIRPLCWRLPESFQTAMLLPIIPLYLVHQNVFMRRRGSEYVRYNWGQALHAARDRFTARYAHRHTEQEVSGWFKAAGYGDLQYPQKRERPTFAPLSLFTVATAVDGVRRCD